jgi:hypothetical protein
MTFTRTGSSPVVVTLSGSGSWTGSVTNSQLDPFTANEDQTAIWSVTARAYNGTAVTTMSAGSVTLEHQYCKE